MNLLTSDDLIYMQSTQQQAMPGAVVIERYTLTNDGMGGQIETWTAIGTVIGRIYPRMQRNTNEAAGGAQILSLTAWWGTLPTGTDVVAQDRLLYGDSTFEVLSVNNDEMYQTAVRTDLEKTNEERRV
jgi:head-tail adaptor